jgi:lipopolysaccharide export system protein LptC
LSTTEIRAANWRRSRLTLVRTLGFVLPAAAGVLVVVVGAQVAWREYQVAHTFTPKVAEAEVRMVNPAFSGEGRGGKHYLVTATAGVRDAADAMLFRLDNPVVVVRKGDEAGSRTTALRGAFRQDDQVLRLEGDVRMTQGARNQVLADNAVIDTTTGLVTGKGFRGSNRNGSMTAGSYSTSNGRTVFKGGVRGRFNVR